MKPPLSVRAYNGVLNLNCKTEVFRKPFVNDPTQYYWGGFKPQMVKEFAAFVEANPRALMETINVGRKSIEEIAAWLSSSGYERAGELLLTPPTKPRPNYEDRRCQTCGRVRPPKLKVVKP